MPSLTQSFFTRLKFSVQHRTLRRIVDDPSDKDKILICYGGNITRMKSRCPHQGAPLKNGIFKKGSLLCNWHGCKFDLCKD